MYSRDKLLSVFMLLICSLQIKTVTAECPEEISIKVTTEPAAPSKEYTLTIDVSFGGKVTPGSFYIPADFPELYDVTGPFNTPIVIKKECRETSYRFEIEEHGGELCKYEDIPLPCPKPGGKGEPHFTTFSGLKYDYHGECDLVLLKNPGYKQGMGMNIHLRTRIEKFYSYIKTAVLQIGEETFEVTGSPENSHWLNGMEGVELPTRISGHPIGYREIDENQHKYNILLGDNGEFIEIATYKHFVSVSIKSPSEANFQGSLGLMGKYETGEKVSRDGFTMIDDVNDFGLEWQVLPSDPKIFRLSEGPEYPEKCMLPTISALESRNLRAEGDMITLEQAHRACARVASSDFDICVFDVLATNDIGIAGAY